MIRIEDNFQIINKIQEGSIDTTDIEEYLKILSKTCNESNLIKDECKSWSRKFQLNIYNIKNFWLIFDENTKISVGEGNLNQPDIVMGMDGSTAAAIFAGKLDITEAIKDNKMKIIGPLTDVLKFRTITELVREELE
jgi:putative sterol carrier protein